MSEVHELCQMPEVALPPPADFGAYFKTSYLTVRRFASYACQLSEIVALRPQTILEIGIGNGILSYLLRKVGVQVTTLDINPLLEPDIVGSVVSVPSEPNAFDVVACFQVLEHLPFDTFPTALQELHRIVRRHAVISLPDATRHIRVSLHLPGIGDFRFMTQLRFVPARPHIFWNGHYWEIGKRGYLLPRIRSHIESAGFTVQKTFRIFDYPYHRVFVLEKLV